MWKGLKPINSFGKLK